MKRNNLLAPLALVAATAMAAAPQGYYDTLYGKTGTALKSAVKSVAADHKVITYGDKTWDAFSVSDVRDVNGTQIWYDMYSNVMQIVADGHNGMNIEHSVPNSWWGGKSGSVEAYSDLHLLNPSNSDANNRKSNWPLGEVAAVTWTNGIATLGTPASGLGGGSTTVFEPADEYKGDFARAYFYVFTVYADLNWLTDAKSSYMYDTTSPLTLKPWAYEMMLRWAAEDPVDDREAKRNEEIAAIQGNRNPYIDMPELASYIWGENSGKAFDAAAATQTVVNRPEAPSFPTMEMPALNTYTGRWWTATQLSVGTTGAETWYSIDGAPYTYCNGTINLPAATAEGETMTITAYSIGASNGYELLSPVATLNLLAKDPAVKDLKDAEWTLVTSQSDINAESSYIIASVKNYGVMNTTTAKSGSSWSVGSDWKATPTGGVITGVTENTAVVTLDPASTSTWYVLVSDIAEKPLGSLYVSAAKKMTISDTDATEATVSVSADGVAVIDFGSQLGCLYYNASQPRFSSYTSTTMEKVSLYRLTDRGTTTVVDIVEDDFVIVGGVLNAPEGTRVFDLQGRPVNFAAPLSGAYIVVTPKGAHKVLF